MVRTRGGLGAVVRWIGRGLLSLLLTALVVAGVVWAIHRQRQAELQLWQAQEAVRRAQQSAQAAAWSALATRGDLPAALARCREAWQGELGLHQDPVALAYTRDELTAYFVVGRDQGSLRRIVCGARGVWRGERVVHPLRGLLPAEAPTPKAGEDSEGDAASALRSLASRPLAPGEDAVELLADPLRGRVLQRRWSGGVQGARPVLDPEDARAFPLLADSLRPRAASVAPPLQPLARHDWLAEPEAAFSLIDQGMPKGARVSELTLEPDVVKLQIESPTPAFDGKPDAPFGERSFDEYGVADLDFWYPRTEPGFGCRSGQPLAAVRTAFGTARGSVARRPLSQAWYSCSTAFGDGRTGVWHLRPRS
jgi:hypothetical protein